MRLSLELRGQRRWRGSVNGNIRALVDGAMVYSDGVNLSSAKSRKAFIADLRRYAPESIPDDMELDQKLLELLESAEMELDQDPAPQSPSELDDEIRVEDYSQRGGRYEFVKLVGHGDDAIEQRIPLANFVATIRTEIIVDDGADEHRYFHIEGVLDDGRVLPSVRVPAGDFASMGWVVQQWGSQARILPGVGKKDLLRDAIQAHSRGAPERRIYAHTGWKHIDGRLAFLHARGAITAEGLREDIAVELEGSLADYALPAPPSGQTLVEAVRASWDLFSVAHSEVAASILGAIYAAPLTPWLEPTFVVWVQGQTGQLKTSYVTLALAHYGPFSWSRVPGNWESSANALERQAFITKDVPFLIDDYRPAGDRREAGEMIRKAVRVIRAIGNRIGRGRMRSDTSLRQDYIPRSLVLATAEDFPPGESTAARRWLVPFSMGTVERDRLTQAQDRADLLPLAAAGYIQYLAATLTDSASGLLAIHQQARRLGQGLGTHLRHPQSFACLLTGWLVFMDFAVSVGAVTQEEADLRVEAVTAALRAAAQNQEEALLAVRPEITFLDILGDLLGAGEIYVVSRDGAAPPDAALWGWSTATVGDDERTQPRGDKVGWIDNESIYLIPSIIQKLITRTALAQNEMVTVSDHALREALRRGGFLRDGNKNHGRQHNAWLEGRSRNVLYLDRAAVQRHWQGLQT